MRVTTITEAKNRLSALLDIVRAGETVLITDRSIPVARLEPVSPAELDDDARLTRLERKGIIRRAQSRAPSKRILEEAPVRVREGASVLAALLEERREGR